MNINEMERTRKMKWRTPNDDEESFLRTIVIGQKHTDKSQKQHWDEYSLNEMEKMLVTAESLVGYALTKKRVSYYGSDSPSHYRIAVKKGIAYEDSQWNNPYRGIASTYHDNQFTITCRWDGWKARTNYLTELKEYIDNRKSVGEKGVNKARLSRIEGILERSLDKWIKRRRLTEEKVNIHYITKTIYKELTNRSLGNTSSSHGPWSFDLGEFTMYLKRTDEPRGPGGYVGGVYTEEFTHLEPNVLFAGAGYRAHLLEKCWVACISELNWRDGEEAKRFRGELREFVLEQLPKFQPHHDLLVRASVLWCQAWKDLIGFMDDQSWGDEE